MLLISKWDVFRENDEQVGFGEIDQRVREEKPTAQDVEETDKVYEFFLKLAGEDMEVDWKELKDILDYSMKSELMPNKTNVSGLDAAPPMTGGQENGNNLLTTILNLICTSVCKDTPLADMIPQPQEVQQSMSTQEIRNKGFSKDVCRSMVAMLDSDKSGKLGYQEFKSLWIDVRNWKSVFNMYDKDNSMALSGFELRQALNSAGYKLNNHILNILMHRYGNKKSELEFDDWIMCAVKLKMMIEMFKQKDKENSNTATFTLEEWIENTLYS